VNIYLAWLISLAGALLSLTFSEIIHIDPCPLCWWQRCALFPLVIILGIAAFRRDQSIAIYALPLAAAGMAIAVCQYTLGAQICTACSHPTEHMLSLVSAIGFFAIGICLLSRRNGL